MLASTLLVASLAVATGTSTTTMTLSTTSSAYGETVTASAQVSSSAGAPAGAVAFSVDGVATASELDAAGFASLTLLPATAGSHAVTATFVPTDATQSAGSTSAAQTWSVAKAGAKVKVPVTGKRRTVVTKVGVKTAGTFDTVPTGKVRIQVKRIGKAGTWVEVRKLVKGDAIAGFGKLKQGRYQVVVKYLGDDNHLAKRKVKQFRVRR